MPDLTTTLTDYLDFELAFIVAYKLDTYSEDVASQVREEVASRNLSPEKLDALVQEKLKTEINDHQQKICPRCSSQKIVTNKEEFHGNNKAFGLDSGKPLTFIEYKLCGVCGWNFLVDETREEKNERRTSVFLSIVLFILIVLLMTYVIEWATS